MCGYKVCVLLSYSMFWGMMRSIPDGLGEAKGRRSWASDSFPMTAVINHPKVGGLRKLKIELPYDPAIPLLGIYPEKTIIQRETCTTMFIEALFTIARTWKQPKCPSTDEWIKKMWHIYTM